MSVGAWPLLCVAWIALAGCAATGNGGPWREDLRGHLARVGERNWIVIADAAFPAHSRRGVVQTVSPAEIPATVGAVLRDLEATEHVRPRIFTARELHYVENQQAPGIEQFRAALQAELRGRPTTVIDYQSLLTLLEDAGQTFDVLVVRTPTALPYSSVFIELQPGYWDVDSETRLRERMKPAAPPPASP